MDLWDYLVSDMRHIIREQLSHVDRLCLARTCKAEWRARNPRVRFNTLRSLPLLINGRTSLTRVHAWLDTMEVKYATDMDTDFRERKVLVLLAQQGWSVEECRTTVRDLKRPWCGEPDREPWDLCLGYLRGNHLDLFHNLLLLCPKETLIDRRRWCLRMRILMMEAAALGHFNLLAEHVTPGPLVMVCRFSVMSSTVWERYIKESPEARGWWANPMSKKSIFRSIRQEWQFILEKRKHFDHEMIDKILERIPPDDRLGFLTPRVIRTWTRSIWTGAHLGNIRWMIERGHVTREDFEREVLYRTRLRLVAAPRYGDKYIVSGLSVYFTFTPCTDYLWKLGYYTSLRTRPFSSQIRAEMTETMRTWIDSHS